jgi:hypothetical protein
VTRTSAAGRGIIAIAAAVGLAVAAYTWWPAVEDAPPARRSLASATVSLSSVSVAVDGALAGHVEFVRQLHGSWAKHGKAILRRATVVRKSFLALRDDARTVAVTTLAEERARAALVPALDLAARGYARYRAAVLTGKASELLAGDALLVRARSKLAAVPGVRSELLERLTTSTGLEWLELAPQIDAAMSTVNAGLELDRRFRRLSRGGSPAESVEAAETARMAFAAAAHSFRTLPPPKSAALRRFVANARGASLLLESAYGDYLVAFQEGRFARFARAEQARELAHARLESATERVSALGISLAI